MNDFHSITHRLIPSGNTVQAAQLHHNRHLSPQRLPVRPRRAQRAPGAGGAGTLLDAGVCVHYSDLGSGQHETYQLPYLYVGGAGATLATNQYVDAWAGGWVSNSAPTYATHFLNVVGSAVGCKNSAGNGALNDFNADTSSLSGYGGLSSSSPPAVVLSPPGDKSASFRARSSRPTAELTSAGARARDWQFHAPQAYRAARAPSSAMLS